MYFNDSIHRDTTGQIIIEANNISDESNGDLQVKGFINSTGAQIGYETFSITQENNGFAGLYVNSLAPGNGKPFYGYALNDYPLAWHHYNSTTET